MKTEVTPGEPPSDGSPQRRPLAPAIRIAAALPVARIVEDLKQGSGHTQVYARVTDLFWHLASNVNQTFSAYLKWHDRSCLSGSGHRFRPASSPAAAGKQGIWAPGRGRRLIPRFFGEAFAIVDA